MVKAALGQGTRGVVVEGLAGATSTSRCLSPSNAIAKGALLVTSRVPSVRNAGKTLVGASAVTGYDLSPQKARMLLLQEGVSGRKNLQTAVDR